jgi:tRNA G10  N-methylase Trm11
MMSVALHGDARTLPLDDASVDAIVCDPPYGLSFMGKDWDHGVPGVPFWQEALRVLKPGGHLLAFGGTRTFHRLTRVPKKPRREQGHRPAARRQGRNLTGNAVGGCGA